MLKFRPGAFGWRCDLPDPRDYGPDHPSVRAACSELKPSSRVRPKKTDWAEYFPPVEDQQGLNICSSCACVALAGYFQRRSSGGAARGSRLFLFQNARKLAGGAGNCRADLRTTLKALGRFGLPPSAADPTTPAGSRRNPSRFCTRTAVSIICLYMYD